MDAPDNLPAALAEIARLRGALLALGRQRLDWDGVSSSDELVLESVKCQQLEPAARAAYAAACAASPTEPVEPDWGRGGYKTQVLYWRAVARACADAWGIVAFEGEGSGKD